jgi:ribonuclease HII
MNLKTEKYYWKKGYSIIIGIDEAGRGPLAGPVTAAAAAVNLKIKNQKEKLKIKDKKFKKILRNTKDSKKLSGKQREQIFKLIQNCPDIKFTVSSVGPKTIDKINIERATQKAMKNCLQKLLSAEDVKDKKILILVDGNQTLPLHRSFLKNAKIVQRAIIKGDDKIFSIALASVIAKVTRDKKMTKLGKEYPKYKFEIHKGYPTKLHRKLIKKYGQCEIHRKSYRLK